MDEAIDHEAEERLGVADRVAAADRAAGLGNDTGGGVEDGRDGSGREVLGECGHVESQHHPSAHGENIAAGVGSGDGSEVVGIVHEWWEEVCGGHHRQVVADAVHGSIVERDQSDEQ